MLEQIVSTSRISTYERGSVHDSRAMARLKVRWLGGGERATSGAECSCSCFGVQSISWDPESQTLENTKPRNHVQNTARIPYFYPERGRLIPSLFSNLTMQTESYHSRAMDSCPLRHQFRLHRTAESFWDWQE